MSNTDRWITEKTPPPPFRVEQYGVYWTTVFFFWGGGRGGGFPFFPLLILFPFFLFFWGGGGWSGGVGGGGGCRHLVLHSVQTSCTNTSNNNKLQKTPTLQPPTTNYTLNGMVCRNQSWMDLPGELTRTGSLATALGSRTVTWAVRSVLLSAKKRTIEFRVKPI